MFALFLGLVPISFVRAGQQTGSSLTELNVEYSELKVAFDAVMEENKQLRNALSVAEAANIEMRSSLATISSEAEVFRRQSFEMKKRFEAVGTGASGDPKRLEQRLLAAVSELQVVEGDKRRLTEAMIRLSEAALGFTKTAPGSVANARLALEAEVRNANVALGVDDGEVKGATPIASALNDASVISVKEELALVIVNLGNKHGIRVGMPFQVLRKSEIVGAVRVVDVREKFSGAVIQHLSSETNRIQVGDRLIVDTQP